MLRFESETHTYFFNGRRVPSVTQILDAELGSDYEYLKKMKPRVLERAAQLGSHVHKGIDLDNRDILDWDSLDLHLAPYICAARRFKEQYGVVILASEKRLVSAEYLFAGTLDLLCMIKNRYAIIDWKTASVINQVKCDFQIAGYEHLCKESNFIPTNEIVLKYTVQLFSNGLYKVYKCKNAFARRTFLSYVQNFNRKEKDMTNLPKVPEKDKGVLQKQADTMLRQAEEFKVLDDKQYKMLSLFLKNIATAKKSLESERQKYVKPINDAKNAIQEFFNPIKETLVKAEKILKTKTLVYNRKKQEEVEKQLEKERQKQKTLDDILAREAEQAKKEGNVEMAELIDNRREDLQSIGPIVPINQHKQKGVVLRDNWKASVSDSIVAIEACFKDDQLRHLLCINEKALAQFAKAHKDTCHIDGIHEKAIAVRTA